MTPYVVITYEVVIVERHFYQKKKSMMLPVPSSDWSPELECDGDGADRGSASAALAPPMSPFSAWGDNSCLSSSLDAPFSFSVSAAELIMTVNRTELSYVTGNDVWASELPASARGHRSERSGCLIWPEIHIFRNHGKTNKSLYMTEVQLAIIWGLILPVISIFVQPHVVYFALLSCLSLFKNGKLSLQSPGQTTWW